MWPKDDFCFVLFFYVFLQLVTFRHVVGERGPWERENRKTSYPFPSHLALVYHPLYANDFLYPEVAVPWAKIPKRMLKTIINNIKCSLFICCKKYILSFLRINLVQKNFFSSKIPMYWSRTKEYFRHPWFFPEPWVWTCSVTQSQTRLWPKFHQTPTQRCNQPPWRR